ncbi:hypothetical protein [Pseudomonas helmanticensis]|nr:hypothetical protein [Pseudomonas helmanticensis]
MSLFRKPRVAMIHFANVLSIFGCFSFFACAAELPITQGMPFLSARKALLKQGWQPNLTDEMNPDGLMKTLRNMGVSEVQRCTEGVQYCEFDYRKNNECLVVSTTGEKVKDMRINNWGFKCPDTD